ncbi:MAG: hypothetical protein RBT11_01610 [Desulfobacterales bacterium]|jgi:hypothetical protein|nr:hypothetical protein [Desulfobacterales bacterium]
MANMSLGAYTFVLNPASMDIPESKKLFAEVKTYSGSAIFQWPALIQGQTVELFWSHMGVAQYEALRALYLSDAVVTWNPQYLGTYQVVVSHLEGKYLDAVYNAHPYRYDVKMKLNIRSFTAT